jgi:hypothetical protein
MELFTINVDGTGLRQLTQLVIETIFDINKLIYREEPIGPHSSSPMANGSFSAPITELLQALEHSIFIYSMKMET